MAKSAAEMLGEAKAQIEEVTIEEASREIHEGDVVILDVREPTEWEQHIPGALQVPRGILEFVADPTSPRHLSELDPACRVIVYCASGTRAAFATATLTQLGFENAANLSGGFSAWKEAGLPISEHHAGL